MQVIEMNKNQYSEFTIILKNLLRKVNRIERNEKICHGVTVSQCQIIDIVYENEDISMNQLSNETGLAMSTLTRAVDLLVRDGIVKRNRSENDRRKVILFLTEMGLDLQKKLHRCSLEYTIEILERIPEEKREELINALKLLDNAASNRILQCCSPLPKGE
jgi:DNA-binding MarR family transcriptional regulator